MLGKVVKATVDRPLAVFQLGNQDVVGKEYDEKSNCNRLPGQRQKYIFQVSTQNHKYSTVSFGYDVLECG